jgi:hypothetical protein
VKITEKEALTIALAHLVKLSALHEQPLELVPGGTIRTWFGWVFQWNTAKYLKTGDFMDTILGTPPFAVDEETGAITTLGVYLGEAIRTYARPSK